MLGLFRCLPYRDSDELDFCRAEADIHGGSVALQQVKAMSEYRKGISKGVRQKWWHFEEHCEEYPTRSFSIRNTIPPTDELCIRCDALKHGRE